MSESRIIEYSLKEINTILDKMQFTKRKFQMNNDEFITQGKEYKVSIKKGSFDRTGTMKF